jgi:(E)-4-hydroxy-3-methylbut-2-enyl-diphosphate synthase
MRKKRRNSRLVWVGEVPVGGDHPIVVQSMTTTDTRNVEATVKQIISLQEAGCE